MKYCSNCGERLSNSPKFCGECGKGVLQSDNQIIEETNLPVDKTIVDTVAKEDHDTVRLILVDTVVKGLNKSGLIDKKGNWVIQPIFDNIWQHPNGYIEASINDKWGFIDKKGNWVIEPLFDTIWQSSDGYIRASINDKVGSIDKKGNWVIQPLFDSIGNFEDGVATASINDKWGLIDKKGNWVIQPLFDFINDFKNGLATAEMNGKWGVIDKKGNWVIQPLYASINDFKDGLATAEMNDKRGVIDKKGNWVIQPLFDSIDDFEDGLATAEINGKFGFIDKKGNWVIQPIYDIPHDDDDVYEWDDDDGPSMKFERRTFDPELYLSTFIDNETTFLGHNNIINHINTKTEYYQKFFYEAFLDYFNEYLLNSLENYIEEKVKISDIKYNFMYYHDEDLLLVFSYKDAIGTFIKADEVGFGYLWESQKGLKVLKEKKRYAIILIFDEEEDEDFDEEFPPQAELRLSRPKSGLFDAPWKFKFTDIVTAMVDARKEYLLLKI